MGCNCGCHHDHNEHHDHCECHHEHHEDCGCGYDHCGCGHDHCGCGHDHCGCGHDHSGGHWRTLAIGAGVFVLALILQFIGWQIPAIAVYAAAYLVLGWQILLSAGKGLFRGHILDENFLMSIAGIGAFAIGEYPEAVGILLFFRIGEYFEDRATRRSRSQIMEAVDLRPETVTLENGQILPAKDARVGDVLLVHPGDRIPLDGVVVAGESRLDTSAITGESVPVAVGPNDPVVSGSVNTAGLLHIRVEKPLEESMVTRILEAVEHAAEGKPKIQRFITRFARVYTPIVVAVAVLTVLIPGFLTGDWRYWVYTALSFLVMSCPCALVLSVPLAYFSGVGAAGKKGILFKDAAAMEALAAVQAVAMDKTGTLTKGEFRLQTVQGEEGLLQLCASCEQNSTHPIAVSITTAAREQGIALDTPETMEEISGKGICAQLEGSTVLCGNAALLEQYGVACDFDATQPGSYVLVAKDGKYLGYLLVSDSLKNGAEEAFSHLRSMGITTALFTGDTEHSARAIAEKLRISHWFARLLPQQKLEKLQQLRQETGRVLFVGDGINDAPVLAGADVGAAMGGGTDAAMEAADVVLLHSDPQSIPRSVAIARATRRIAWQNVVFALAVKALVMVLGLLGYASMWMAVFADSGVAMLCVLNSIRLLYQKK